MSNLTISTENLKKNIINKLTPILKPIHIEIIDNSAIHNINIKKHLSIIIISNKLKNKPLIKRHKLIYRILKIYMKYIHALNIATFTENEYKNN